MQDVTAAIIRRGQEVLIARRGPREKSAGAWEFPGGKVEVGETPRECLWREMNEEFAVGTIIGEFVAESIYHHAGGVVRLLAFEVTLLSADIRLSVHDEYRWVSVDDLLNYELLPADIPIAEKLRDRS